MGLVGDLSSAGTQYKLSKDARKDLAKANKELTTRMTASQRDYAAQRPIAAENRMNALRAQLGILSPLNQLTSQITGQAPIDASAVSNYQLNQAPLQSMQAEDDKAKADALAKLNNRRRSFGDLPFVDAQAKVAAAEKDYANFIGNTPSQSPGTRTRRGVR